MDAPAFLLADFLIIARFPHYQGKISAFASACFPFSIGQILLLQFRSPYPKLQLNVLQPG
jgi:hypothetical protein